MDSLLDQGSETFDENKDWLSELVGEGKKYKDQGAAAKALAFGQHHIQSLEYENKGLREELTKVLERSRAQASLQEMVDQIKQEQVAQPQQQEAQKQPTIDPTAVESLIDRRLTERETSRKEQENFQLVKDKLEEKWGRNYHEPLNREMRRLGLDNVDDLAKRSPQLLIEALGLTKQQDNSFQAPPGTSQRFVPQGQPKRDWDYYEDLRRKDPVKYYSGETTRQMQEDYQRMGKDFETPGFKRFAPTYLLT